MTDNSDLGAEEYASLRDEMLRSDDQTVTLTGFALVAASFLAAAVIEAPSPVTKTLLLVGFNIIILTLVIKVREKRGQQGRIAAYLRVFHENSLGWESRVHNLRRNEGMSDPNPWGLGDPRERERGPFERFNRRAAIGEFSAFTVLSLFALAALALSLVVTYTLTSDGPEIGLQEIGISDSLAIGAQFLITVLVLKYSRTFRELEANSERWQRIWENLKVVEELRHRIAKSQDIILINGGPGSGKTTLGQALGPLLGLDLVSKDSIKETMADEWLVAQSIEHYGPGKWTLVLPSGECKESTNNTTMDWLDDEVTRALIVSCARHRPCIIDANVADRQAAMFESLAPRLVELLLVVDPDTLIWRYNSRPNRHWIHAPQASGNSSAWGGSSSVVIPGATRIELPISDSASDDQASEATIYEILSLLAHHYGLEMAPPVSEAIALQDARAIMSAQIRKH